MGAEGRACAKARYNSEAWFGLTGVGVGRCGRCARRGVRFGGGDAKREVSGGAGGLQGACSPQNAEGRAHQQAEPQAQGQCAAAHGAPEPGHLLRADLSGGISLLSEPVWARGTPAEKRSLLRGQRPHPPCPALPSPGRPRPGMWPPGPVLQLRSQLSQLRAQRKPTAVSGQTHTAPSLGSQVSLLTPPTTVSGGPGVPRRGPGRGEGRSGGT